MKSGFTVHAEGTRDLGLTLAWIVAALIAGVAANLGYIVFGVFA